MKAIVRDEYGTPDVLSLEEIETPTPADDEVLAKVVAASINTADADQMQGYPRVARLGSGVRRPRTRYLGLDMAGRVETVGRNVSRFRPGDEVWADLFGSGSGAFAEYVCAREGAFHPKSAELTFEQAATLPHSGLLALQGLDGRGRVRPGERVLINGAGGCVGPFANQLAKAFGAEVSAVDHTEKLDLLVSLGADHVIDYTREDLTKSGRRYDLILDIAATRSVFAYRRSPEEGGRYVLVTRTPAGFFSAALFGALISMGGTKEMGVFKWVPNKREDLDYLGEAVADGKVDAVAGLDFATAAAVPIAGLAALQGIRDAAGVEAGQKVLINGASGGVGTYAIQIAKTLGAEVTAVCSTRDVDQARAIGADHVIDYTKEDFTKGAARYDVVFDNAASHSLASTRGDRQRDPDPERRHA